MKVSSCNILYELTLRSRDDGDAKNIAQWKLNLHFTEVCRNCTYIAVMKLVLH